MVASPVSLCSILTYFNTTKVANTLILKNRKTKKNNIHVALLPKVVGSIPDYSRYL